MPSYSTYLFTIFYGFIYTYSSRFIEASNSVPMPIHMDKMLSAGRHIYDKHATPTMKDGVPTTVNLSMYIEGIGSFQAQTMDFQLDVYLQQFWKDPRLAHNETKRILLRDREILKRIWHPDVYFANARIAQFHEVTQPNFLIWIESDGSILYDTRVSMIVICAMQLQNYPLDSQWCHLRILSYAYDVEQLLIAWNENEPITRNPNITMSDMHIVKLIPGLCNGNYSTGSWSCVTAEIFVTREITHHILQTYVPTTLIVIISWFSFWLDVEAVPARVSLAITTLLTLSTQANSVRNSLPEVSYMKSLDLFLAVSVLFVFGVLIEFTIVNYTQRNATLAATGDRVPEQKDKPSLFVRLGRQINHFFQSGTDFKNIMEGYNVTAISTSDDHNNNNTPISVSSSKVVNTPYNTLMNYPPPHTTIEIETGMAPRAEMDNSLSGSSLSWNGSMCNNRVYGNGLRSRLVAADAEKQKSSPESEKGSSQYCNSASPIIQMNNIGRSTEAEWQYRDAERLANWAKPELSCDELAITLKSSPSANWARLASAAQPTCLTEKENTMAVDDNEAKPSTPKSVLSSSAKWRQAVRQIQKNKREAGRIQAKKIDAWSRWAFPLSYLTFHLSYWTYYLYLT
ncbi:neurotransmitter-gated ion-channel ligand binding domain-containing protein [Ditylenchus destructor]|uniref:Neurotransmitter-gated ion-channel ligand binding domain-containing protein n=1 Tax=Ditylenchus destructor TaxID=166010 RepID=A0AAD4RBH2_9BILA|nr:neurotransmitter-gated ion-channel ligand binding domain-containing protein [Ditylenchus destructor]